MINTQSNTLPASCVLTRSNVSRFAIVLFAALLALWQGVVFGSVPNTFISGQSTVTVHVDDGDSGTSGSSCAIYTGVNEIIKTGGGTWIIDGGLIWASPVSSAPLLDLQAGTIDIRGNSSVTARLVMYDGTTLISDITEHDMSRVSTTKVMVNFSGSGGTVLIKDGKTFGVSVVSGQHPEFSGTVQGEGVTFSVYSHDNSGASLTLSGNNTFTGQYLVRRGARLILTDDAISSNASVYIDEVENSTLEYYVKSGTKRLDLTDGKEIKGYQVGNSLPYAGNHGTIEKTGDGTLQIYAAADGAVKAESFVISSGRVDYQGYFDSFIGSGIDVKDGAVFSPGLSDSGTIGEAILKSPIILESGSTILFEFGSYSGSDSNHDVLTIDKNARNDSVQFKPQTDSFIELDFLAGAAAEWAEKGAKYLLIADERTGPNQGASQILTDDYTYLLRNYTDMFELQGVAGEGIYLVGLGAPVPEPSTWALLILGAAGLICVQLRKKK